MLNVTKITLISVSTRLKYNFFNMNSTGGILLKDKIHYPEINLTASILVIFVNLLLITIIVRNKRFHGPTFQSIAYEALSYTIGTALEVNIEWYSL